jgi:hypothetical protein
MTLHTDETNLRLSLPGPIIVARSNAVNAVNAAGARGHCRYVPVISRGRMGSVGFTGPYAVRTWTLPAATR